MAYVLYLIVCFCCGWFVGLIEDRIGWKMKGVFAILVAFSICGGILLAFNKLGLIGGV